MISQPVLKSVSKIETDRQVLMAYIRRKLLVRTRPAVCPNPDQSDAWFSGIFWCRALEERQQNNCGYWLYNRNRNVRIAISPEPSTGNDQVVLLYSFTFRPPRTTSQQRKVWSLYDSAIYRLDWNTMKCPSPEVSAHENTLQIVFTLDKQTNYLLTYRYGIFQHQPWRAKVLLVMLLVLLLVLLLDLLHWHWYTNH